MMSEAVDIVLQQLRQIGRPIQEIGEMEDLLPSLKHRVLFSSYLALITEARGLLIEAALGLQNEMVSRGWSDVNMKRIAMNLDAYFDTPRWESVSFLSHAAEEAGEREDYARAAGLAALAGDVPAAEKWAKLARADATSALSDPPDLAP